SRVPKDSVRVEAYGTVDELNSAVGVLLAVPGLPPAVSACLTQVQHELFDLGGELCIPGHRVITASQVTQLEQALDGFNDALPPLKEFILPGGGPGAAACHLARLTTRALDSLRHCAARRSFRSVRKRGQSNVGQGSLLRPGAMSLCPAMACEDKEG